MNQMREAQRHATYLLRRESMASIILNGIASGLYRRWWVSARAQKRAVKVAVQLADMLMAEMSKPPETAPSPPSVN